MPGVCAHWDFTTISRDSWHFQLGQTTGSLSGFYFIMTSGSPGLSILEQDSLNQAQCSTLTSIPSRKEVERRPGTMWGHRLGRPLSWGGKLRKRLRFRTWLSIARVEPELHSAPQPSHKTG